MNGILNQRIDSLQSLRGVGAIMIVLHHYVYTSPVIISFGDMAVSLFLMLSGLVMFLSLYDRFLNGNAPKFSIWFTRRVMKIYPLYFITMALMLAVFPTGVKVMLVDFAMLQSWIPNIDVYYSGNSPLWFISDLMLYYLLLFPLMRLLVSRPEVFAIGASVFAIAYFAIVFTVPESRVRDIIYIQPFMQLPAFLLGLFLGYVLVHAGPLRFPGYPGSLLIAAIAISIGAICCYKYIPERLSFGCYWWIPNLLLIWSFIAAGTSSPPNSICRKITSFRPLVYLGNISLSIYMIHFPWIQISDLCLAYAGIELSIGWRIAIGLPVIVALSALINRFVEQPVYNRLNSLIK